MVAHLRCICSRSLTFPRNEKLESKIGVLKERIEERSKGQLEQPAKQKKARTDYEAEDVKGEADGSYHYDAPEEDTAASDTEYDSEPTFRTHKPKKPKKLHNFKRVRPSSSDPLDTRPSLSAVPGPLTPRTTHLLSIINMRGVHQIEGLKGVGPKHAEGIVVSLAEMEQKEVVGRLRQLSSLRGVGGDEGRNCGLGLTRKWGEY